VLEVLKKIQNHFGEKISLQLPHQCRSLKKTKSFGEESLFLLLLKTSSLMRGGDVKESFEKHKII